MIRVYNMSPKPRNDQEALKSSLADFFGFCTSSDSAKAAGLFNSHLNLPSEQQAAGVRRFPLEAVHTNRLGQCVVVSAALARLVTTRKGLPLVESGCALTVT